MVTLLLMALPFCILNAQEIRSIHTEVLLNADGSADVTQTWDVTVVSGTEWYIPVSNLKDMKLSDLSVSENGVSFINEGFDWDVDRSLEEKAGKCGIIKKGKDLELCWGQGTLGDHVWTTRYHIDVLVKSLNDYDAFNHQFVNPGLVATPQKVSLTIINATGGDKWTYDNTRLWAFGFEGNINLNDGVIEAQSTGTVQSVIAMVSFNKGLFSPSVSRDIPFEEMLDQALKGSSYKENNIDWLFILFAMLTTGVMLFSGLYVIIAAITGHIYKKKFFGQSKIKTWYRDTPLDGDIPAVWYVHKKGLRFNEVSIENLIGTFFLKWIFDGSLKVLSNPDKKKNFSLQFTEKAPSFVCDDEKALYDWALEASGDRILERSEFKKWARKNSEKLIKWPESVENTGLANLIHKGYFKDIKSAYPQKYESLRHVVEFKNFLKDFTLSDERGAEDVMLWKNYLIYAQMFDIADKVAKQFKSLYPDMFEAIANETGMESNMFLNMIIWNNSMTSAGYQSALNKVQQNASGGFGGPTSFGGGGGFSGGGFGGGSR